MAFHVCPWPIYIARCPKSHPRAGQGPSVLQSASIRNSACREVITTSPQGARTLSCAGPKLRGALCAAS
eukprot:7972551-Alexandrium_andersonii.AAC.1